jgi:hypothetical protein
MIAFLSLKLNAERRFQCGAQGSECRCVFFFQCGKGIACIRSEKPSDIFGLGQRRRIHQHALQELYEVACMPLCGLDRMGRRCPKASFVRSKTVEFALKRLPSAVVADEPEVAIIGHEDETVPVEVFARLPAFRRLPCVIRERLYLDDASLRDFALPGLWLSFFGIASWCRGQNQGAPHPDSAIDRCR